MSEGLEPPPRRALYLDFFRVFEALQDPNNDRIPGLSNKHAPIELNPMVAWDSPAPEGTRSDHADLSGFSCDFLRFRERESKLGLV
mgnify:CR=1 FL=1